MCPSRRATRTCSRGQGWRRSNSVLSRSQPSNELDPRSVANTILSFAEEYGLEVTQLSLQKIVYFVHGRHLVENGCALVSGHFEAWPYGPVHPTLYASFSKFGSGPIVSKATKRDLISGIETQVSEPQDKLLRLFIRETASRYLKMSPGRLVELSHAPKSPWDQVTLVDGGDRRFGMRIDNKTIADLFKYHKISVGASPRLGELDEESLPSGD